MASLSDSQSVLGVDLGTTNSLLAITENGKPRIVPVDGEPLLPSVVGRSAEGQLLVGRTALNQYRLRPEATVRSVKRHMGDPAWSATLGPTQYDATGISSLILGRLRGAADAVFPGVKQAVITVPAYFAEPQRRATLESGQRAGFDVVRIINEPTAAALMYSLAAPGDQRLLVYDLGGGTFDASLVEIQAGVTEVLASHGNRQLGGDDFDERLVDHLADTFKEQHDIDLRQDPIALARLYSAAEAAKIRLSTEGVAEVREEFIAKRHGKPLHLQVEVTRQTFEHLIEDLLQTTLRSVRHILKDAGSRGQDVSKILMVGGSSRIPAVLDMVAEEMGQVPHHEIHPEQVVALGAAVQGALIAGQDLDVVLVDVCAHSLGIEVLDPNTMSTFFSPIIRRNTVIPASRSQVFYTTYADQDTVHIRVFQGESRDLDDDTPLGDFRFSNLSPAKVPTDAREVLVRFDYDPNGMLKVAALDRVTEREVAVTLDPQSGSSGLPEGLPPVIKTLWGRLDSLIREGRLTEDARREAGDLLGAAPGLTAEDADGWIDRAGEFLYVHDDAY